MTKSKKRASRFYVEQDGLYETSDFSSIKPKNDRTKKHKKATEAEKDSQKIIAVNAPVDTIRTEDDTPATELRESRIDEQ